MIANLNVSGQMFNLDSWDDYVAVGSSVSIQLIQLNQMPEPKRILYEASYLKKVCNIMCTLQPCFQPLPSFSILHAEKWEALKFFAWDEPGDKAIDNIQCHIHAYNI